MLTGPLLSFPGLTLVSGSHLFNDGHLSLRWGDFDPPIGGCTSFEDWSKDVGGVHLQTGKPLQFETISVKPGSICAVALYTLHGVAPVARHRDFTRYGA
eukprot:COSAG03_NODE_823_length_5728_cov_3.020075_3_plen_99_part_00